MKTKDHNFLILIELFKKKNEKKTTPIRKRCEIKIHRYTLIVIFIMYKMIRKL